MSSFSDPSTFQTRVLDDDYDENLTAGFDPDQLRDPHTGEWIDDSLSGPKKVADTGTRWIFKITDQEKTNIASAWKIHSAKLRKKYGRDLVKNASDDELVDLVRQIRSDANVDDVTTIQVANYIEDKFHDNETLPLFGIGSRVTNAIGRDKALPIEVKKEKLTIPDNRVSKAPRLKWPRLKRDEGIPAEIFGGNKTEVQQNAIYHYTGQNFEEYTDFLRGKRTDVRKGVSANIDHIRAAMAPSPKNMTLFRYVDPNAFGDDVTLKNLQDRLVTGKKFNDPSFLSTGVDEDGIFGYERPIMMQIEASKGTPMVYAGDLTANEEDEGEMILRDGLNYEVVGVWQSSNGTAVVRVRIVL